MLRDCLLDPIPEIYRAADHLNQGVTLHLEGRTSDAIELFKLADDPAVREWTNSLWGSNGPSHNLLMNDLAFPTLPIEQRIKVRMPNGAEKRALILRDGYHCRFCGIPLIRSEIRRFMKAAFPAAINWGRKNTEQHAALQAMWLQFDHVLPHARGGNNDLSNIVLTCAPCNFARMNATLAEVGLNDPRTREPVRSEWDGLERILRKQPAQI